MLGYRHFTPGLLTRKIAVIGLGAIIVGLVLIAAALICSPVGFLPRSPAGAAVTQASTMAEVLFRARLTRDDSATPWGFRLQGGADYKKPLTLLKVSLTPRS